METPIPQYKELVVVKHRLIFLGAAAIIVLAIAAGCGGGGGEQLVGDQSVTREYEIERRPG